MQRFLGWFLFVFAVLMFFGFSVAQGEPTDHKTESERITKIRKMHTQMLNTGVRVLGENSAIGSGVIIYSQLRSGEWHTYVATNWHVVKYNITEITDDDAEELEPLRVQTFRFKDLGAHIATTTHRADIVYYDKALDFALLRLQDTEMGLRYVAKRLSKGEVPMVFETVWNIGAGLGEFVFPTFGMFSTNETKMPDGNQYWMVSAQAINGNSGGGSYRFNGERYELIGIVTALRIIPGNSGMFRVPIPVTHMVLIIPIHQVCKSLGEHEYGYICG